jgi:hypothetical protein
MEIPVKRLIAEKMKLRIEAELEQVEEEEAQGQLKPIERPDETFLVMNLKARKERLLDDLHRCKQMLGEKVATA